MDKILEIQTELQKIKEFVATKIEAQNAAIEAQKKSIEKIDSDFLQGFKRYNNDRIIFSYITLPDEMNYPLALFRCYKIFFIFLSTDPNG